MRLKNTDADSTFGNLGARQYSLPKVCYKLVAKISR